MLAYIPRYQDALVLSRAAGVRSLSRHHKAFPYPTDHGTIEMSLIYSSFVYFNYVLRAWDACIMAAFGLLGGKACEARCIA